MDIKIANHKAYNFEQVMEEQNKGASFVTYQWIIPLPWFSPIKRLSSVYFIDKNSNAARYAKKYNTLNLLFGWWGLPFGPVFLWKSIYLNNNGGIDVTEDVYLNLSKSNYENGKVSIINKATKFIHPTKNDLVEFKKAFNSILADKTLIELPHIAYFIDTEKHQQPYYVIAINENIEEGIEKKISKAIYKRFYKSMKYKLVCITDDFDDKEAFIKQALKLGSTK